MLLHQTKGGQPMIIVNGEKLSFKKYPNRETMVDGNHLRRLAEISQMFDGTARVILKYESDEDLIHLMFVKSFLTGLDVEASLHIAYMPYSRMDRVEGDSAFTLRYVTDFINSLFFSKVVVVEPHSDVTMALLDRSKSIYPSLDMLNEVMREIKFDRSSDYLFFPDQGAQKRYGKKRDDCRQLVGFKERDFSTGTISKLQLVGTVEPGIRLVGAEQKPNFKAIIVDDLCSYGNTFIRSAEVLREAGATEVYLLVTHAEDSIFKGNLFTCGLIDKVFTTNTLLTEIPEGVEAKISVMEMIEIGLLPE